MPDPIAPISSSGLAQVLALNNAHAAETSFLDQMALNGLLREAFYARQIGALDAFLVAFDESAEYDSPNFLWFRPRYPSFVYVDRIITAPEARGTGCARPLYEDLFGMTRASGRRTVCCEVNANPPNPGSDAFHKALGFKEVGGGALHGGQKTVRYLTKALTL